MAVDGGSGAERGSGLLGSGGEAESRGPEPWVDVRVRRKSFDVVAPRVTMMFSDWSVVEEAGEEMPEGCCAAVSRRSEHWIRVKVWTHSSTSRGPLVEERGRVAKTRDGLVISLMFDYLCI